MHAKRKIPREANGDVVVASTFAIHAEHYQGERTIVGVGLGLQTRRELRAQMGPCYRNASFTQKKQILHEFAQITGYNRKYAMWLLNHTEEGQPAPVRPHQRLYGPEVQEALVLAWNTMNRLCAKRLMPYLPTLLEAMERHEQVHLTDTCREQLLTMSAATADRLLRAHRGGGLMAFAPRGQEPCSSSRFPFARSSSGIRPNLVFSKLISWLIVALTEWEVTSTR
jgi:hypothetical protein